MPFVHGKNATIWVWDAGGACRNMSGDKNSITLAWDKNNPETTTFGKVAAQRIAGLTDATLSGAGIWNSDDTTGLDDVLGGILAASTPTLVQFSPAGSLAGCPIYSACYQMSQYDVIGPIGGVVAANWEFQLASGSMTHTIDYLQTVLNAVAAEGYWPLAELTGASAFDFSGNARTAAYNGTYTLGQTGIGDGRTAPLFVNASMTGVNVYSAGLAATDILDEGFVSLWALLPAAKWADSNTYYFAGLTVDGSDGINMRKANANQCSFYRRVGATLPQLTLSDCPTTERWVHIAFSWSLASSVLKLWINGTQKRTITTAQASGMGTLGSTSAIIGSLTTSNTAQSFPGKIAHVVVGNGSLTTAQARSLASYTGAQVVFDGDSRSNAVQWPATAMESAFSAGDYCFGGRGMASWAVGGKTVAQALADAPTDIDPLLAAGKNTIVIWGGVNDNGASSASQIYDNLRAYCLARKAAGWQNVILCTEIDAVSTGWTTKYQALNALIAADHSFATAVADLGANAALQDHTNLTYYNADGVHLIAAGYDVVASIVAPVLAALA